MANRPEILRSLLSEVGPARFLRLAFLNAKREIRFRRDAPAQMNLALQGGGALGAFTWGVLDVLLERSAIRLAAVSGASAGALNAAVLASGLVNGGRRGARRALSSFWTEISRAAATAHLLFSPFMIFGQSNFMKQAMKNASPYDMKPLNIGPLRTIIETHVDFAAVKSRKAPRLFVSATNVETAEARVFTNDELTLDVLLASACLPALHPTVWIDGAPYWDGGFSSNPPLVPLAKQGAGRTLLIRLIRAGATKAPGDAAGVDAALQRLMFGRPLDQELARLALLNEDAGRLIEEIDATGRTPVEALISAPTPRRVGELFEAGRAAGADYLTARPDLVRRRALNPANAARKSA